MEIRTPRQPYTQWGLEPQAQGIVRSRSQNPTQPDDISTQAVAHLVLATRSRSAEKDGPSAPAKTRKPRAKVETPAGVAPNGGIGVRPDPSNLKRPLAISRSQQDQPLAPDASGKRTIATHFLNDLHNKIDIRRHIWFRNDIGEIVVSDLVQPDGLVTKDFDNINISKGMSICDSKITGLAQHVIKTYKESVNNSAKAPCLPAGNAFHTYMAKEHELQRLAKAYYIVGLSLDENDLSLPQEKVFANCIGVM